MSSETHWLACFSSGILIYIKGVTHIQWILFFDMRRCPCIDKSTIMDRIMNPILSYYVLFFCIYFSPTLLILFTFIYTISQCILRSLPSASLTQHILENSTITDKHTQIYYSQEPDEVKLRLFELNKSFCF